MILSSLWSGNEFERWPQRRLAERWQHQAQVGIGAMYALGYIEHSVLDAQALEMFSDRDLEREKCLA